MSTDSDQPEGSDQDDRQTSSPDWTGSVEGDWFVWKTDWEGVPLQITVVPALVIESWPGPVSIRVGPTVSLHKILADGSLERLYYHEGGGLEECLRLAEDMRQEPDSYAMLAKL